MGGPLLPFLLLWFSLLWTETVISPVIEGPTDTCYVKTSGPEPKGAMYFSRKFFLVDKVLTR